MAFIRNCLLRKSVWTRQIFKDNFQLNKFVYPIMEMRNRDMSSKSPAQGKVALITGGSIGIGMEFGKALLQCGAKGIVFGDIREKEGEALAQEFNEKYGKDKAFFMKCDVTKKDEFEDMFKCTMEKYKQLDIVINNAGLLQDKKWSLEIDVNVKGVVQGTIFGFQYMGKHNKGKGGAIVNVASIYGLQVASACPVYNGTKAFVILFSAAFSNEHYYKMSGVKVFTICPGVTITNMIHESADYGMEGFGDVGKMLSEALANLPSQPAEACGKCLIKILCADENGAIFVIEENECYKVNLWDRHKLRAC